MGSFVTTGAGVEGRNFNAIPLVRTQTFHRYRRAKAVLSGQPSNATDLKKMHEIPWNADTLIDSLNPPLYPPKYENELRKYRVIIKNNGCCKRLSRVTKISSSIFAIGGAALLSTVILPIFKIVDNNIKLVIGVVFATLFQTLSNHLENQEETRKNNALANLGVIQNHNFPLEYTSVAQKLLQLFLKKYPLPTKTYTQAELLELGQKLPDIHTSKELRSKFITDINSLALVKLPQMQKALNDAFGMDIQPKESCCERFKRRFACCFRKKNEVEEIEDSYEVNVGANLIEPLEAAIAIILIETGNFSTLGDASIRMRFRNSLERHKSSIDHFYITERNEQIRKANRILKDAAAMKSGRARPIKSKIAETNFENHKKEEGAQTTVPSVAIDHKSSVPPLLISTAGKDFPIALPNEIVPDEKGEVTRKKSLKNYSRSLAQRDKFTSQECPPLHISSSRQSTPSQLPDVQLNVVTKEAKVDQLSEHSISYTTKSATTKSATTRSSQPLCTLPGFSALEEDLASSD